MWWPKLNHVQESCQLVAGPDPQVPTTNTKIPDGPWQFCSCGSTGSIAKWPKYYCCYRLLHRFFEAGLLRSRKTDKKVEFLDTVL